MCDIPCQIYNQTVGKSSNSFLNRKYSVYYAAWIETNMGSIYTALFVGNHLSQHANKKNIKPMILLQTIIISPRTIRNK